MSLLTPARWALLGELLSDPIATELQSPHWTIHASTSRPQWSRPDSPPTQITTAPPEASTTDDGNTQEVSGDDDR